MIFFENLKIENFENDFVVIVDLNSKFDSKTTLTAIFFCNSSIPHLLGLKMLFTYFSLLSSSNRFILSTINMIVLMCGSKSMICLVSRGGGKDALASLHARLGKRKRAHHQKHPISECCRYDSFAGIISVHSSISRIKTCGFLCLDGCI